MRFAVAGAVLGALAMPASAAPGQVHAPPSPLDHIQRVEFWCSPGFAPRHGRCIATQSRDELYIYESDSTVRLAYGRRALRERY